METPTDCDVCCMPFNSSTRTRIPCEHDGACSYAACKTCVRTYLLGTTSEPNCMSCSKPWSDKFLTTHLKASFVKTEYKTHRKELLIQQEISRIPESMAAAETYKRIFDIRSQIDTLNQLITDNRKREKIVREKENILRKDNLVVRSKEYSLCLKTLSGLDESSRVYRYNIKSLKHDIAVIQDGGIAVGEERKVKKTFIMPCPGTDCRGFLNDEYNCEMCKSSTCSKCFELIVDDGEGEGGEHVCKKENIESAEFIRKQSKPCPCCGTRISKIDGCDQMWCTQCHKAFSWNTGKIVTGIIHNPHYYQFQRELGGGNAPRNPGDVVCGGVCGIAELLQVLNSNLTKKEHEPIKRELSNIHRLVVHFSMLTLDPLRRQLGAERNNEEERLKYIVKEISREKLGDEIFKKDSKRKRETALLHICEMFVTVATDIFAALVISENKGSIFLGDTQRSLVEFNTLRDYSNHHFKEISITYGICVPFITTEWRSAESMKYNSKGGVDKYIEKREEMNKIRRDLREKEWNERQENYRVRREQAEKAQAERDLAIANGSATANANGSATALATEFNTVHTMAQRIEITRVRREQAERANVNNADGIGTLSM